MQKTATVKTSGGEVTVKKLALGEYADLLKAMQKLPSEVARFLGQTPEGELKEIDSVYAVLPKLPSMIGDSWDDLIALLEVVSDKDKDFLSSQIDLADAVDIVGAALELNEYNRVAEAVKKIMGRKTATKR